MNLELSSIKRFFRLPWHPLLFAIFPVLFLYSYNIEETTISMTFKPLVFVLVGTTVFLFLSNLVFRNWFKSAVFTSLAVLLIFFHGHIHDLIGSLKYQVAGVEFGTDDTLFIIWFLVASLAFILLLRTKRDLGKFTAFLNFMALVLVLQSIVTAVPHEIKRWWDLSHAEGQEGVTIQGSAVEGIKPDIYYIILDRYDSNKTLQDFYGYDNSYFTDFLKGKGFYIAEDSFANYPRSFLSLSSSLNMVYHEPPMIGGPVPLIRDHTLGKFLKSQGYRYLHLGSWTGPTGTNPLADENFKGVELYLDLDEFTLRLVEKTAFAPLARKFSLGVDLSDYHTYHRTRALYQFDRIEEIAKTRPSPKFVFAHILLPHDPYVFGPNCEHEDPVGSSIERYLSNLSCTNILASKMVNDILGNSALPPVVIIQGDEGHYAMKYPFHKGENYQQADPRSLQERARIFNSYYLPDMEASDVLHSSITPVNTFRVVLNLYFNANLDLFADRSFIFTEEGNPYYYDLDGPVDFIEVTELIKNAE